MVTEEMAALASPHVQRQLQWEGMQSNELRRREFESASDTSLLRRRAYFRCNHCSQCRVGSVELEAQLGRPVIGLISMCLVEHVFECSVTVVGVRSGGFVGEERRGFKSCT